MRRFTALLGLIAISACSSPSTDNNGTHGSTETRPLFSNQSVGTSGGTLTYSKAGDALNGLAINVPAAAYASTTTWTVTADSTVHVTLPQNFAQVGPVLVVSNNQGYANSVMTLTMPMNITDDNSVAPFFFDPATGKLEGIPLIDRTATSATLGTRHFSGDVLATRGPTQTPLRASLRTFGAVDIVWVRAADSTLKGTFTTGFKPGRDDWEFANYGDWVGPGGDCEGMSITALYYQYFVKPVGASYGLYHQYDSSLPNQWDNVQGIRFAGSVQGDYVDRYKAGFDQIADLSKNATYYRTNLKTLTASWLMLTMKLTGNPVLMGLQGDIGGHAVVAYAGSSVGGANVTISFADPNFPGTDRTMTFTSGVLTPVSLQLNKTATSDNFTSAYALGVSAEVPLSDIDARYAEFKVTRAGTDRYPATLTWDYVEGSTVLPLDNTVIHTSINTFTPKLICPSCSRTIVGATIPHEQVVQLWDANGANSLNKKSITLARGDNNFVLEGDGFSPYGAGFPQAFLDSRTVNVIYAPSVVSLELFVQQGSQLRSPALTGESIQVGNTLSLIASATAADGLGGDNAVTWQSSNNAVATVSASGVVTGVATGTAQVTARSSSAPTVTAVVTIIVTVPNTNPIASMVISPRTATLTRGSTRQFSVTLLDSQGHVTSLPAGIAVGYAEDDSNLGSIDTHTGLFQAAPTQTGSTIVRAFLVGSGASQNIFDSATVTITN